MPIHKIDHIPIISLSRDSFRSLGYDPSGIDDEALESLSERMADAFLTCCYWTEIVRHAKALKLPPLEPD